MHQAGPETACPVINRASQESEHLEKLLAEAEEALKRVHTELDLMRQDEVVGEKELLREIDQELSELREVANETAEHKPSKSLSPRANYTGTPADYALTK